MAKFCIKFDQKVTNVDSKLTFGAENAVLVLILSVYLCQSAGVQR